MRGLRARPVVVPGRRSDRARARGGRLHPRPRRLGLHEGDHRWGEPVLVARRFPARVHDRGWPRHRRCGRLQGPNVRLRQFGAVASGHPRGRCRSASAPVILDVARTVAFAGIHEVLVDDPRDLDPSPVRMADEAGNRLDGRTTELRLTRGRCHLRPSVGGSAVHDGRVQPYGGLSEDAWRDRATNWLCTREGMAFGSWTVDGASTDVVTCGSPPRA